MPACRINCPKAGFHKTFALIHLKKLPTLKFCEATILIGEIFDTS